MKNLIAIFIFLSAPVVHAVTYETVFNTPGFQDHADLTVENKLVDLIDHAAAGSSIRMTQYNFSRPATALALIAASVRGVDVRLVLDGNNLENKDTPGDATALVLQGLKCSDGSCVKFCKAPIHFKIKGKSFGGSCNGVIINHNKFFLFSKLTDGSENVVAQSSENFTESQMHMYNDLLVIKGDRGLYDGYHAYWENLFRNHFRFKPFIDAVGSDKSVAKFFPRLVFSDPVVDMLKRVSCKIPGSIIRVAAADFTRASVAARLRDLAEEGCDVKAITRFDRQLFSPGKGVARRLGSQLMILPFKGKTPELRASNSIHTKLMLIRASVDGSIQARSFVLTGSHNLDFFSLHTNDETLLELENASVFTAYLGFWNRIESDARAAGFKLTSGDSFR